MSCSAAAAICTYSKQHAPLKVMFASIAKKVKMGVKKAFKCWVFFPNTHHQLPPPKKSYIHGDGF